MLLEKGIRPYSRLLAILDRLLPPDCILCHYPARQAGNICRACQNGLPILPQHCRQCAEFLPFMQNSVSLCGACLANPPPFAVTHALFPYHPPIIQLIIRLKFGHDLSHAAAFSHLLTQQVLTRWYKDQPLPDLIMPVPLHPLRLRERGFNQALEIARPVARTLGLSLDCHSLQRIRHTTAQSGLPAQARKNNMMNAFVANRHYAGLSIALIDDVISTGHTITACCRTLKAHGAKRIDVWCCARNG